MNTEILFFTIVDAEYDGEHRVEFEVDVDNPTGQPITFQFPSEVTIHPQQMAELGHLLIALSGHNYDHDSVDELLDGYECGLLNLFYLTN